jgi:serine/threonine protein kinase/Flp pilus assembly protein TadD
MNAWNPEANAIFLDALDTASAEEREAFLDRACGGNSELRARVESLLAASEQAGSFLDEPAAAISPTIDEPSVSERPSTMIGPYKLLQQIGEGGMGVVWMAEQELSVRRKVALKIIKPGLDSQQVIARFEAERQALALMDHHNIAKVLDAGTTESGRPFFVMELIHGVPITRYCDDNQLTPRERLELFVPVCQAIQHAHQKGIIHRDIKPSNVLVTLYDGKPAPKIIDFGVAKAIEQRLTEQTLFTQYGTIIGTFEYMSPEQAEMSALGVDTRSDIYSLGVLLYELLTGTTPLERQRLRTASYPEIVRLIREEEPPRPSKRLSSSETLPAVAAARKTEPAKLAKLFRGELDWIVMKALEKDRNRRYESASSMAADVERYLRDEAVLACPPSTAYRLHKFARRNKAELSIAGLVLFFLILIGVGVGYAVRDRAAREEYLIRNRAARQEKLNLEIEHALDDADKGRELALKLTDNPYAWEAALAESLSDLKRAKGLAAQDETALKPDIQERLHELQTLLNADESDRRFAARFEDIRLEQTATHTTVNEFQFEIGFSALKEAFGHHYRIAFGVTPVEQAAAILRQRPEAMREVLLAALEMCLHHAPKGDHQARPWLVAVLDAADTGSWRKRAQQAIQARDWKALDQLVEEAVTARQPPSVLLRLAWKVPSESPICLKISRRIRQSHPSDFWANHSLARVLHESHSQPEEAIRYYTAALALRPHNPAACLCLGNALREIGDLDGAIAAYREALDGQPDFIMARQQLSFTLQAKGDVDGAIAELRQAIRFGNRAVDHLFLGNAFLYSGRADEAIDSYRKAIALDPKSGMAHYSLGFALLEEKGRLDEVIAEFQSAIACQRRDVQLHPENWISHNDLAWYLVTCPHLPLRDPVEGVKLAAKVVGHLPNYARGWNTLGAAHYYARNCKDAIAALEKSTQLSNGGNSYNWFFLAMAHWQLGDKEKARQYYDKAVQWMDKNMPKNKELGRFRVEAAELLKIEAKKR